jgi:hypothetical protein
MPGAVSEWAIRDLATKGEPSGTAAEKRLHEREGRQLP